MLVGPTTFTLQPGGSIQIPVNNFHITSFFDIFTELSIDGTQSWVAASSELPEPSSIVLTGAGFAALLMRIRRR